MTKMHFKKASFQSYIPTRDVPRIIEDISVEDVEKRRAPTKHYAYVVYVAWTSGVVSVVHRTYQDFQRLHNQLQEKFNKDHELCAHGKIIPELQGRVILGRNNVQKVALRRLQLLDEYCKVLSSLPALVSSAQGVVRFFQPTDLDVKASCPNRGRMSSRRKGQQGASEISTPLPSERYVAVTDYVKNSADEMTLTEGDSLEVFIRDESGWWLVCKDQLYGWVPYSYLEKVDGCEDAPVSTVANGKAERYMAMTQYSAEEADEVGLQKGQVVEVLEKHMDGWWRIRYANQEGMAPAVNLAKADSRKARRALEKATTPPEPEDDDLNPRLSLFESPRDSDSDSDKDDFVDTLDIIAMRERLQSTMQIQQAETGGGDKVRRSFKKRAMCPPPRKSSLVKKSIVGHAWAQQDPEDGVIAEEPDQAANRQSGGSDEEDTDPSDSRAVIYENIVLGNAVDVHEDESDNHDYYNVSPFNRKLSTKGRPQYESRSAFKAGDAGETDLCEGETVSVLEKTGTGWWLVQSEAGVGWVPSHFLKLPSNRTPAGPTVADLRGDVFEETAPQKWTPKLPNKKETMKKSDHIAFKYLSSARGESGEGHTNGTGKERPDVPTKPTANSQNTPPAASPASPKPLLKPRPPGGQPKSPKRTPLTGNFRGVSPTNSGSSHSTHSTASSSSSGSSSRLAPTPPKKPSSALKVTPSEISQKQESLGDNEEKVAGKEPSGRSVKDLKAMFSRS